MKIIPGVLVLILGGVIACSSHGNKATGPVGGQDAAAPSGGDPVGAAGAGGSTTVGTGGTVVDAGGSGGETDAQGSTTAGALAGGGAVDGGSTGKGGTGGLTSTAGGTSAPDAGTDKSDAAAGPCGDGVLSAGETCDDGNLMPFDGCSSLCRVEPTCTASGCTSKCGDGLVVGEDCDDGNTADGDGCSSACKVETGWTCTQPAQGDKMMVPAVFRDFRYYKPTDFQPKVLGTNVASPGMVENALDADSKPVYTGLTGTAIKVESASSFVRWYRDTPGVNHTTTNPIALWKTVDGLFVNRYGSNGEQWNATEFAYFVATSGRRSWTPRASPSRARRRMRPLSAIAPL